VVEPVPVLSGPVDVPVSVCTGEVVLLSSVAWLELPVVVPVLPLPLAVALPASAVVGSMVVVGLVGVAVPVLAGSLVDPVAVSLPPMVVWAGSPQAKQSATGSRMEARRSMRRE